MEKKRLVPDGRNNGEVRDWGNKRGQRQNPDRNNRDRCNEAIRQGDNRELILQVDGGTNGDLDLFARLNF